MLQRNIFPEHMQYDPLAALSALASSPPLRGRDTERGRTGDCSLGIQDALAVAQISRLTPILPFPLQGGRDAGAAA